MKYFNNVSNKKAIDFLHGLGIFASSAEIKYDEKEDHAVIEYEGKFSSGQSYKSCMIVTDYQVQGGGAFENFNLNYFLACEFGEDYFAGLDNFIEKEAKCENQIKIMQELGFDEEEINDNVANYSHYLRVQRNAVRKLYDENVKNKTEEQPQA